jgi:nucleolar protein 56
MRWPTVAVEKGDFASEEAYYDALHEHLRSRLQAEVRALSEAEDVELLRTERLLQAVEAAIGDIAARRDELTAPEEAEMPPAHDIGVLAVAELRAHADGLTQQIDRLTHRVAPNLRAIAGPRLSAQLIEQAGGLERLARKPSGTVQVLGAENALFAHLQGRGPSPKHGVIYTHPAVRHAPRTQRGAISRMLAGKLAIAARIDHYRGSLDEAFIAAVTDRLQQVRS